MRLRVSPGYSVGNRGRVIGTSVGGYFGTNRTNIGIPTCTCDPEAGVWGLRV